MNIFAARSNLASFNCSECQNSSGFWWRRRLWSLWFRYGQPSIADDKLIDQFESLQNARDCEFTILVPLLLCNDVDSGVDSLCDCQHSDR